MTTFKQSNPEFIVFAAAGYLRHLLFWNKIPWPKPFFENNLITVRCFFQCSKNIITRQFQMGCKQRVN